jgi:hypothetical protein
MCIFDSFINYRHLRTLREKRLAHDRIITAETGPDHDSFYYCN